MTTYFKFMMKSSMLVRLHKYTSLNWTSEQSGTELFLLFFTSRMNRNRNRTMTYLWKASTNMWRFLGFVLVR